MKYSKKLLLILFVLVSVSRLHANLPQTSSFFTRACNYVPFKTTLGLGIGLIGGYAYYVYNLSSKIEKINFFKSKIDKLMAPGELNIYSPETRLQLIEIKKELESIGCQDITKKAFLATDIIIKQIDLCHTIMYSIEAHEEEHLDCDFRTCSHLADDRKYLAQAYIEVEKYFNILFSECDAMVKTLAKEEKKIISDEKAQTLAVNINKYWGIIKPLAISSFLLIALVGITNYFSR